MKTRKVCLRRKDIYTGMTVYVACPKFGINKLEILSKPIQHHWATFPWSSISRKPSWKFDCVVSHCDCDVSYFTHMFTSDVGMEPKKHNYKRTFRTYQHAQEYINKMKFDPQYQASMKMNAKFHMDYDDLWDTDWDDECDDEWDL